MMVAVFPAVTGSPQGTGEAPALSPPVRGFSTRALQARSCTHTSSKRGQKRKPRSGRCDRGIIFTQEVRVTVLSAGLERPTRTKRLEHQMLAMQSGYRSITCPFSQGCPHKVDDRGAWARLDRRDGFLLLTLVTEAQSCFPPVTCRPRRERKIGSSHGLELTEADLR